MADHHAEIVIIKRHSEHEDEHHGGAWKIAFADFMTAMMAFFLVLWIVNATDKHTKTIIARYFNPVRIENSQRATKGIHKSDTQGEASKDQTQISQAKDAKDKSQTSSTQGKIPSGSSGTYKPASSSPTGPKKTAGHLTEEELFADPYAILDKIASGSVREQNALPAPFSPAATKEDKKDTFKPIVLGGSLASLSPESHKSSPDGAHNPPALISSHHETKTSYPRAQIIKTYGSIKQPPQSEAHGANTESASPLSGLHQKSIPPYVNKKNQDTAKKIKKALGKALSQDKRLFLPGPDLEVVANDEGIRISVTDSLKFSMFSVGSAIPRRETIQAMAQIAHVISKVPGQLIIRGFTDARPYKSKVYDNWRLSSARAQMAYYMLVRGGVPKARFEAIEGFADRRLKDPANPDSAINRRIEILVRVDKP